MGDETGVCFDSLLFALTIEPLATAIRTSLEVQGFQRATGEEKMALYVSNVLLLLGDTQTTLATALEIYKKLQLNQNAVDATAFVCVA